MRLLRLAAPVGLLLKSAVAVNLILGDDASVKAAASTIAFGLARFYTGNNTGDTPGNLPDPYFWWEAGAMFGTLIDYWALTGDASYNAITTQAILHQATPKADFMPSNQTRTLGNDDQGFWGMAAMSAAERNFPNPPADQPQWLALAQSLFNQFASRWDEAHCGGGLRWQIFTFNNGFNYKNSISNGCFFSLAARLARYTGNQTYADWATKIFRWEQTIELIGPDYAVHDGVGINPDNNTCRHYDSNQWSYNAGIFLHGAAVMYNYTNGSSTWRGHVDGLLRTTVATFFTNASAATPGVMYEMLCEPVGLCNTDQRSFKGYLTRWLAATTQMAPYTFNTIRPLLEADAAAAAKACTGAPPQGYRGPPGTACGFQWTTPGGGFDGKVGVGEQMNALSAVMYTLVGRLAAPVTADTGGTSKGNPGAQPGVQDGMRMPRPVTVGDRVAAGLVTTAIVLGVVAGSAFVMV